MQVNFDEINYLIYRYFLETGYHNAAYTFFYEAEIDSMKFNVQDFPMGLLVHIMHKALQMVNIEMHLDQQGCLHHCNQPLSFLKPHSCNSAHILNQAISREQIQIQSITSNGREMKCLDNLPKPILIVPKQSMKVNDEVDLDEQLQEIAKRQREQENEIIKSKQANGDQKATVKIEPDIKLAQETSQIILSQLKLQETLPQRNEIVQVQKQLQMHQQDDSIDSERIIEDKPKYQLLTIFHQPTSAAITCIHSTNVQNIQETDTCTCTNLICSCIDTNTKPILDVPVKFVGTAIGELFVYQLSSSRQDFVVSQDLLYSNNKSPVISIIVPNGQQRAVVVQDDGQITIFRIHWDDKLIINKLYQSYPVGKFKIIGVKLNVKSQILCLYGNAPEPMLFYMRTRQVIMQSIRDTFQDLQNNDGISMMYALLKQDQTQKINNTQNCQIIDIAFFGHKGIVFIRDDGLIQINEVITESDISYSVVYRNFIKQNVPNQLLTIDQLIYVITDGTSLYEFNTQSLSEIQPVEHVLEAPIQHVTVITNETMAYLHDKGNVFLASGCIDGHMQIKNNWQLQTEIEDEQPIIFNSDSYCFIIDNVKHLIYTINISQDDVQIEQLSISEMITAVSADQKLACTGSSSGIVIMSVISET